MNTELNKSLRKAAYTTARANLTLLYELTEQRMEAKRDVSSEDEDRLLELSSIMERLADFAQFSDF